MVRVGYVPNLGRCAIWAPGIVTFVGDPFKETTEKRSIEAFTLLSQKRGVQTTPRVLFLLKSTLVKNNTFIKRVLFYLFFYSYIWLFVLLL